MLGGRNCSNASAESILMCGFGTTLFSHFGPQSARKQESRQNRARNRFSAATETESNGL